MAELDLANIENHCILSDLDDEEEDDESSDNPALPRASLARISQQEKSEEQQ